MIPTTVEDLCELFDCQVLKDLGNRGGAVWSHDETVFFLGRAEELSAGLHGYTLTKGFLSRKALDRYCHSRKGRLEINKAAGETFVGEWDTERQCWKDDDANA